MKQMPFFANPPDGTHCLQAAFKSILKYFLPERDFSYAQLDKMSQKQPGKGTWWPPLLLELAKLGLQVKDIAPFDYQAFYRDGDAYVKSFYTEEVANYHLKGTNLPLIKPILPEFLKKVTVESRPAALDDIKKLLAEGWLVAAAVNSRTLNHQPGFSGHVVVVFDFDEASDSFHIHDPGLPARQNWLIGSPDLGAAFNYVGAKNSALVAARRQAGQAA